MAQNEQERVKESGQDQQGVKAPSINLPKGGGAIKGIGEKFAANPVTGTGSMTVPIATSPGRSGFGPQLSFSYDSGAGNGPFGFGWSLSLPSISRKTDKGLPQYRDAEESDIFILSGVEDLVPEFEKDDTGTWVMKDGRHVIHDKPRVVDGIAYTIRRYRPRIEGLFARIERWTNSEGSVHWRSISKDNILTIYGKDDNSRIADSDDKTHIFSWLICETRDDKGNAVIYNYKGEDGAGVTLNRANERNRTRTANRYLKRIVYGNKSTLLDDQGHRLPFLTDAQVKNAEWMFEVVFDYGDHDSASPKPGDDEAKNPAGVLNYPWKLRHDSFSSYRSGFEVRTYRLCQRVLMFHHFPGEANVERDCLVRSTDFTYSQTLEPTSVNTPAYTFLLAATQSGYKRDGNAYLKRSLPPVEFEYSQPVVQDRVEEVDAESLENLPIGVDGSSYQWTDLHGEGIPGILTEQGGTWYYKRNISPINIYDSNGSAHVEAKFAPVETVAEKPNLALAGGAQFMDLAGDGQLDLVVMDGPMPGFYEHDTEEGWQPFRSFSSRLNRDMHDPNLKLVDLDGDGHADVLITEDNAFIWHPSLAEEGFGPARRVTQAFDEEKGPRLVFADGTQSIYLADLSGDGLSDLVRIRNGEVCYWPNLGYCRFGAKVTMDNSPWFDNPDQFDHKRIRLADIDGSGTTDIIYLHRDGVRLYFNQSGNCWSNQKVLNVFLRVDDMVSIVPTDLLGNGTTCLLWSSPLPGDARRQMRYVNLMGNQKPHLLLSTRNNLGAVTSVQYAPSTKFYLQDKRDGKPWITKLPFPVHVVEKVTVTDKWRKTSFSTTYSYHHGYFDGIEREFRGFGRVEQVDVESYGEFAQGNVASPYITSDKTLYQPPVKTTTWYHTGAFFDRERILSRFEHEYFPNWLKNRYPNLNIIFKENPLPEPDLGFKNLTAEEWREALRACKGMMLRQEIVELDVDALERPDNPEQLPVRLLTTAYHNCHIGVLQPKAQYRHAVFLVAESEAITYHYELDIRETAIATLSPDPRIAHTLNLQFDDYANILQSVAIVYPRIGQFQDNTLSNDDLTRIHDVQKERHLAYSETRYTEDFGTKHEDKDAALDNHRLRLPCEVLTYELTGIKPKSGLYFTLNELQAFQLSQVHQKSGTIVPDIPYHQIPDHVKPEKRLVEQVRTLFFDEKNLIKPLPFRQHGRLGLTFEAYKLALTKPLLDAIFIDKAAKNKLDQTVDSAATARAMLDNPSISGYLSGAKLTERFPTVPVNELDGQYWIRSGIAGFAPDAAQHFYLPERYTDPFDNITTLEYDGKYDLFIKSSTDAMGNTTSVTQFDFRVLAPREMQDINDNLSEVYFDVLGLPAAMAVKGKGAEGDNLTGFTDILANPSLTDLSKYFDQADLDELQTSTWLGNATARHIYYFGESIKNGLTVWGEHPACACGIVREKHVSQMALNEKSPLQAAFEYSDGMGSIVVKKIQAEPEQKGQPMRWVASGKTILNNKGKPVKQYEPYFSSVGHKFEEPKEEGVTPIMYYDAAGRTVRTEMPDGSYSRVEFSPWQVLTFDPNDTAFDPASVERSDWYQRRMNPAHPRFAEFNSLENKNAAKSVEAHGNTPALTILDSLGRNVISVAHNRVKGGGGLLKNEKYFTFTKLDAEGKPLWIRDSRGNLVMQYINPYKGNNDPSDKLPDKAVPCYDIAGNLLFQHSMDAGDRWMLNDAVGKSMLAWDSRGQTFCTDYDKLHRPVASFVKGVDRLVANHVIQYEKVVYGDTPENGLATDPKKLNLRGKPYQHYDTAGLVTSLGRNPDTGKDEAFDFKGNLLRSTRKLIKDYKATPDWSENLLSAMEEELFSSCTHYDALNRPVQLIAPHSNRAGSKINVIQPGYNEANLLEKVDVWLGQNSEPTALLVPATSTLKAVTNIDYDAKGQRKKIEYNEAGHPIITEYNYDKETFRLVRLLTTRPNHPDLDKRTLQDLSYTYDPSGNINEIRDTAQQTVFFRNTKVDAGNTYLYDALYRLIHAVGREHAVQNNVQRDAKKFEPIFNIPFPNSPEALQSYSEEYEYDAVGNILRFHHIGGGVESWVRRYQYAPDSNRLLSTSLPGDDPNGPYSAKYNYTDVLGNDVQGCMTSMPHLKVMEWDFKDQLHATQQQVVNNDVGEKTYYVYDAGGQRVRKVTETQNGNLKDERIYLGGFEVYRKYNGNGQAIVLERETLHVMDDKQRIALVETKTITNPDDKSLVQLIRFQLGNHLGSAVLELDKEAQVISYEEYHPYGTTAYQSSRSQNETPKRYRYTGKERDEETGFTYHGARYYAPWLGRWTSSDPTFLRDGTNLFLYVSCAPVNLIDQHGFAGVDPLRSKKYSADMKRRMTDLSNVKDSKPKGALPGAKAGEDAWKTSKTWKGELRNEARRTGSNSPYDWHNPGGGSGNAAKRRANALDLDTSQFKKTTGIQAGHPYDKPSKTHGDTGKARPEFPQDNQNKGQIFEGRKSPEKVAPLPEEQAQVSKPAVEPVVPKSGELAAVKPSVEPAAMPKPAVEAPKVPPKVEAPKDGVRGSGAVVKAAGLVGMALLARDLVRAKSNEQRAEIVASAAVGSTVFGGVAKIPVVGQWVAAGAAGLGLGVGVGTWLAEDVIPDSAQVAAGKVLSEKVFGVSPVDHDLLEKFEVGSWRPFAPN